MALTALLPCLAVWWLLPPARAAPAFIPDDSAWMALDSMITNVSTALSRSTTVHHITVATKIKYGLECLNASVAWHGDSLTALGYGDARFQAWGKGFGVKLEMAQVQFRKLPVDDLVLFTDAYDVLVAAPQPAIRDAYVRAIARHMIMEARDPAYSPAYVSSYTHKYGAPPSPRVPTIVFSTEIFCWPDDNKAGEYPEIDQRAVFPYLNSGTYIGRVGDLLRLMEEEEYDTSTDDQRYFTSLYFKSRVNPNLPRVMLDHYSDVFLCTNGFTVGQDIVFDPALRRWKHVQTPGVPTIIHFNGGSKWNIPGFFDVMQGNACYMCPWQSTPVGHTVITASVLVGSWLVGALLRLIGIAVKWKM